MSFLISMLSAGTWASYAPIREFGNFLSTSFEANLAYSVIIRLGNFAGASIFAWAEREMLRVIPALSETKTFNERAFTSELTRVRTKYQGYIRVLNAICVSWAVFAAFADILMLALMPFHLDAPISADQAFWGAVTLFGAVPIGIAGSLILHLLARKTMRDDSKAFDKMIEILENAPAEKVKAAHDELIKRLAEQRAASRVGQ